MNDYSIKIPGSLIERGFWLYVWKIVRKGESTLWYVGRTGDSSSGKAQSPLNRVGQHLNQSEGSRSNALTKQLSKEGISAKECDFEYHAIGPIYANTDDQDEFRVRRDKIATLERWTADWFLARGFRVLGTHPRPRHENVAEWSEVESFLNKVVAPVNAPTS